MGTQVVLIDRPTRVYNLHRYVCSDEVLTPQVRAYMAEMGVAPMSASSNVDPLLAQAIVAGLNRVLKQRYYWSDEGAYLRTRSTFEGWMTSECYYCEMVDVPTCMTIEAKSACAKCVVEP